MDDELCAVLRRLQGPELEQNWVLAEKLRSVRKTSQGGCLRSCALELLS